MALLKKWKDKERASKKARFDDILKTLNEIESNEKMAMGGEIQDLKSKIEQIDKYLKKLENENTQEAYEKSNNLRDYKNFLQAKVLHLEHEKMAEGGEVFYKESHKMGH